MHHTILQRCVCVYVSFLGCEFIKSSTVSHIFVSPVPVVEQGFMSRTFGCKSQKPMWSPLKQKKDKPFLFPQHALYFLPFLMKRDNLVSALFIGKNSTDVHWTQGGERWRQKEREGMGREGWCGSPVEPASLFILEQSWWLQGHHSLKTLAWFSFPFSPPRSLSFPRKWGSSVNWLHSEFQASCPPAQCQCGAGLFPEPMTVMSQEGACRVWGPQGADTSSLPVST